jgi:hypothetical protein
MGVKNIYVYFEKLPLYTGAHIGGIFAVHLKNNYVHITISPE